MRGCEPCVSCMGLGLNKGIKIFESVSCKKTTAKFWAIIIIPTKFLLLVYVVIRIFNKIAC